MTLPINGRIVVVDDSYEEAMPLIQVLSKLKTPVIYYSGELEQLPDTPLEGIRLLFMDLRLVTSGEPKNIIAAIKSVLSKIISEDNGPYVLLLWSTHDSRYIEDLRQAFNNELIKIKPIVILNMEKGLYMSRDSEQQLKMIADPILQIQAKLTEELNKFGSAELFIIWENLVHRSAGAIVNDFASFYPLDNDWNTKMSAVFLGLAAAYAGEQLANANLNDIIKAALFTFNGTFIDLLESNILKEQPSCNIVLTLQETLDESTVSKINTKLLLQKTPPISGSPGTIYLDGTKSRFFNIDTFVTELLNKKESLVSQIVAQTTAIFLEVSPSCDYAQNKWKTHRILPGVLFPSEYKKHLKRSDFMYITPLLEIESKNYNLIFDFRYMTAVNEPMFTEITNTNTAASNIETLCKIRHDLLTDIQAHLARHINRPGVQSL